MVRRRRSLIERMPPAFREHYFSLFTGPEPETVHPDLYRKLIDEGTDIILRGIKRHIEDRRRVLERVRDKIRVKQLRRSVEAARVRLVASDAGNNGVDLRAAFLPLYAATAILVEGWEVVEEPITLAGRPEPWPDEFRAREREAMLAAKLQFDVTVRAVSTWRPRLVLLDGTLLLNPGLVPTPGSSQEYVEDFRASVRSAVLLLSICHEEDIPVFGFVKRTRARILCRKYGGEGVNMRDTSLLDLVLRPGQYTEPEPMEDLMAKRYRREAERMSIPAHVAKEITSFCSSYIRTGLATPYRLEFPEYCRDRVGEVGAILYTTSEEDGIPFAIHEADHLTKLTTNLSNIRTLMLYSKALDLVKRGELDDIDLNLLALQHGEAWVLRADDYFKDVLTEGGG